VTLSFVYETLFITETFHYRYRNPQDRCFLQNQPNWPFKSIQSSRVKEATVIRFLLVVSLHSALKGTRRDGHTAILCVSTDSLSPCPSCVSNRLAPSDTLVHRHNPTVQTTCCKSEIGLAVTGSIWPSRTFSHCPGSLRRRGPHHSFFFFWPWWLKF
jgi:hypothetical protein